MLPRLSSTVREGLVQQLARGIACLGPRTHDQVHRRDLVLVQAEGFLDDPADAVAFHRAAGHAHRHGQPQPRRAFAIEGGSHAEESVAQASPACVGRIEVLLAPQAKSRRQSKPPWHRGPFGGSLVGCAAAAPPSRDAPANRPLGYQLVTTLGAPAREHPAAGLGGHARTEPVGALAAHFARLVGPLAHTEGSVERFVAVKKGRQG